jgi:archaellum component FlaG (FlaF/FlaG flagellin family)
MPWNTQIQTLFIFEEISGVFSGIFGYSGTPAAGNLVYSLAPAAGTDPWDNAYKGGGLAIYSGTEYVFLGLNSTTLEFLQSTGWADEGMPFNIETTLTGTGATESIVTSIGGPALNVAGATDQAGITLGANNAGATLSAAGTLYYITTGGVTKAVIGWDSAGAIIQQLMLIINQATEPSVNTTGFATVYAKNQYLKSLGADNNQYDATRLTMVASGQTINSTSPTTVTGLSCNVSAGTYKFRALVYYAPTVAAGTPTLGFTGPATSAVNFIQNYENNAGAWSRFAQTTLAASAGPTMTVAGWTCFMEGTIVFTAFGTFAMTALTSAAADTFTILGNLSTLELFPVTA